MILILDLDDTLYPEADFVRSGFRAVAASLGPTLGIEPEALEDRLAALVAAHGRGDTFNRLLDSFGADSPELVDQCVRVYREHRPQLELYPGVREMLQGLQPRPLYLVTDGDPQVQAGKIEALEIAPFFRECLRTWTFGREAGKPSLTCFARIRDAEEADWPSMVYVGDDPAKDFVSLNAVGAVTVRVHTGRHADAIAAPDHDAQHHVATVVDVPRLLGI